MTDKLFPDPLEGKLSGEREYEVLSALPGHEDVEVRAWPMGIITMHRGDAQATIDTTDMTREEVVRSLYVGLSQLDQQAAYPKANRAKRRKMDAKSRQAWQ